MGILISSLPPSFPVTAYALYLGHPKLRFLSFAFHFLFLLLPFDFPSIYSHFLLQHTATITATALSTSPQPQPQSQPQPRV